MSLGLSQMSSHLMPLTSSRMRLERLLDFISIVAGLRFWPSTSTASGRGGAAGAELADHDAVEAVVGGPGRVDLERLGIGVAAVAVHPVEGGRDLLGKRLPGRAGSIRRR